MASSSQSADRDYAVFLSFCGKDTRQGFISHLYDALCAVSVKTFIDKDLHKGDRINQIFDVIREARIHIVVYSTNYASSKWCLNELAEIMNCLKCMNDCSVLPVFYKVNPSTDIKGQNSMTRDHLQNHEVILGKSSMAVAIWKAALIDLAGIVGWHLETGNESKLVKDIVRRVSRLLLQRRSERGPSNSFFRFLKEAGDRLTIDLKTQSGAKFEVTNQQFTPTEVWKITANFKTVIRECTFGKVFTGVISGGITVAVKELHIMHQLEHFLAEARILSSIHHRNLVRLVGYCVDGKSSKAYLVYEFIGNGNLQQRLSNEMKPYILSWNERLSIAREVARGLCHLHELGIIHGDLNCRNVLLKWNLEAKIAGFRFSQAFDAENTGGRGTIHSTSTLDYLDPQVFICGHLNKETDVYSFGIVLFKLITGYDEPIRSINRNSFTHIHELFNPSIDRRDIQSIVDPRLNGIFSIDSAWKVIKIAMSCVSCPAHRPRVADVLAALDECCADNATHTMGPCLPLP